MKKIICSLLVVCIGYAFAYRFEKVAPSQFVLIADDVKEFNTILNNHSKDITIVYSDVDSLEIGFTTDKVICLVDRK